TFPLRSVKRNPQAVNSFAYANNSPIRLRDPLGLSPECQYYDQRCSEVRSRAARFYFCDAAKTVCEQTPRDPYTDCVRDCLQEFDREICIPVFGRKDPSGIGTVACNLVASHAACFTGCAARVYRPSVAPAPF